MEKIIETLFNLKRSKEFFRNKKGFLTYLNTNETILELRKKYDLTVEDVNWHITHKVDFCQHKCPICGNSLHISRWGNREFPQYCSSKCRSSDPAYWEKIKQSNLAKYGVAYSFQSEKVKEKIKQSNLAKYGVENPSVLEAIKEKAKNTCLQRYGVISTALVPEIRSKQKETLLRNYGVRDAMQSDVLRNKLIQTKLDQGYNLLVSRCSLNPEGTEPLFTRNEYKGQTYDIEYKWKCKKCGHIFKHYYNNAVIPVCRICHPKSQENKMQQDLIDFIKSIYHGKILTEDRSISLDANDKRKILELDIYLPEINLAFEFDGSYWHSSLYKSPSYHKNKTEICESKGIHLIHVMEYQWSLNSDLIKSKIKSLLGIYTQTIYARKCIVKKIDYKTAQEFLILNHSQGEVASSYNYGLFYQDSLIGVMTFGKPRFNKQYEWELLRFCVSQGLHIPGGASKLLSAFVKEVNPKNILSYADRTWSNGKLYKALGFELIGKTKPNYVYIKNNNREVLPRYKCQKHKLQKLLGQDFDPNLSEHENMAKARYWKLYDCGSLVFVKYF